MRLNREIIRISEETGVPVEKIAKVAFALAISKDVPGMLQEYLSSDELTNDEVEGIFRIRLFSLEEDGYTLKFPLLDSDYVSRFDDFWRMLLGPEYGLTTKGHRINLKNYTPLAKSEGVRRAFELLDERMQLDLDRMCRVISQYYRETEFAVGLEKYLREIAETEYQNFEETVDHRII